MPDPSSYRTPQQRVQDDLDSVAAKERQIEEERRQLVDRILAFLQKATTESTPHWIEWTFIRNNSGMFRRQAPQPRVVGGWVLTEAFETWSTGVGHEWGTAVLDIDGNFGRCDNHFWDSSKVAENTVVTSSIYGPPFEFKSFQALNVEQLGRVFRSLGKYR